MEENCARDTIRSAGGLVIESDPAGRIKEIACDGIRITNQTGTRYEPGLCGVWLRVRNGEAVVFHPLADVDGSVVYRDEKAMKVAGTVGELDFVLWLETDADRTWVWTIDVAAPDDAAAVFDLVYLTDLALLPVRLAEASPYYACQYQDTEAYADESGRTFLCTRQSLLDRKPWLMSGCTERLKAFQTDGSDFYGYSGKATGVPQALTEPNPISGRRQREFGCHILFTEWIKLQAGHSHRTSFFSTFEAHHPGKNNVGDICRTPELSAFGKHQPQTRLSPRRHLFSRPQFLPCEQPGEDVLSKWFSGAWTNVERDGTSILSFFSDRSRHIVTRAKEGRMDKIHGQIIRGGVSLFPAENNHSATTWMTGVFCSHYSMGNPTRNVFISRACRNQWNLARAGGVRIFLRKGDDWLLLGMPSAFWMDFDRAGWYYANADGVVKVTFGIDQDNTSHLAVEFGGKAYPSLVHIEPELTNVGVETPTDSDEPVVLRPRRGTDLQELFPLARLEISCNGRVDRIGGSELLYSDRREGPEEALCFLMPAQERYNLTITGELDPRESSSTPDMRTVTQAMAALPRLASPENPAETDRLDAATTWFFQNALVHLRRTVITIYSHQVSTTGNWPQAFLFDRYQTKYESRSTSHSDVVIWPLKALCDYIEATADYALLDEPVAYAEPDDETELLMDHVRRQIACIQKGFIAGTHLAAYGHGDWNDSLQPVDSEQARNMVSPWTVELSYENLRRFGEICDRTGRDHEATATNALADAIAADFNNHLVGDDLVAGFGLFGETGHCELLFHPSDRTTGIRHRLLPSIRGIISGIFTPDQAERHYQRIRDHLLAPDGARLLDSPPRYDGGESKLFQRAESASFFGREIGMQYVHANLRYAQAMAKLGKADEFYRALQVSNPVLLSETVATALPRQSNCYFSSSDARFDDRYQAQEEYDRVRNGTVDFAGGWRVYSSGPGIFLNLVRSRLLGLRRHHDSFVFDPVLPPSLFGLTCETTIERRPVTVSYSLDSRGFGPDTVAVNGSPIRTVRETSNPYRKGGLCVAIKELTDALSRPANTIEISDGEVRDGGLATPPSAVELIAP